MARAEALAAPAETAGVDVVFNNYYRAQAVVNALQFRQLLERRPVAAPAALVAAYPEQLAGRVQGAE